MPPPPAYARSSVLQGVFVRPLVNAVQAKGPSRAGVAIQRRPGVDAFPVNLTQKFGGWPLPRDVQSKMESALGATFSDVRIHVGPEASAIGAIAFTWGSDIHFAPGQYNPHTQEGQALLGHELAHVVQQRAGRVANPFGSGVAVVQDQGLEAEADRLGRQAAMHRFPESGGSQTASPSAGARVINRKVNRAMNYAVRAPLRRGSGWHIDLAAQGAQQPVGSVQLTASENGVYISDLKVAPEHRRQGLAGQLIDAALRTARSNGYHVAQLEARPDSPVDVTPGALVSMYRKLGFRTTGISRRGNPLMERTTSTAAYRPQFETLTGPNATRKSLIAMQRGVPASTIDQKRFLIQQRTVQKMAERPNVPVNFVTSYGSGYSVEQKRLVRKSYRGTTSDNPKNIYYASETVTNQCQDAREANTFNYYKVENYKFGTVKISFFDNWGHCYYWAELRTWPEPGLYPLDVILKNNGVGAEQDRFHIGDQITVIS